MITEFSVSLTHSLSDSLSHTHTHTLFSSLTHTHTLSLSLYLCLSISLSLCSQDIFLQTKFTSLGGQDPHTVPYDPTASLREQVLQSFSISCKNLHTDYVDSLVLHSPMQSYEETLVVWKAMEEIYNDGGALHLGISNTYDIKLLTRLYDDAAVKPQILQNRFYVRSNYDVEIRKFCSDNTIRYQSFWTLTANPHVTDR